MKTNTAETSYVRNWSFSSLSLLFTVGITLTASSETIGYWRMEHDDDPGIGYSITNETGYSPLTGSSGGIDTGKADSVMADVLANSITNNGSLAGGTGGGVELNGSISSYTNLNAESFSIEFFARTDEGTAGFFTRSTGSNGQTSGNDGISIYGPNSINVRFYTTTNNVIVTNDMNGVFNTDYDWDYHAFTYDATSGISTYYINGMVWRISDGPDNAPLYWGPSNTTILIGNGMDGNAGLKDQDKGLMDELRISNAALNPSELLYKPLIARDSFAITGHDFDYNEGNVYANANNQKAVVGTIGFSVDQEWTGGTTGNFEIRDDRPDGSDLDHILLDDELLGALRFKAKDTRDIHRPLSVTVPESPVYYMCALLHSQEIQANEDISIGFSDAANNRNKGIHVGFNDGHLAVFAGNTAYNMMSGSYELNTTYLVVLRLTANTSGLDTIDVYLAKEGAETIDFQTTIEVETFSSTADLSNLKLRVVGNNIDTDNRKWWADEVRLATEAGALGIDPSLMVVQPPAETVILIK